MAARLPDDERLQELLAARASEGLSPAEQEELRDYIDRYPAADLDEFDRVAASIALAGLRVEPMPAALRARIEAEAQAWFAAREAPAPAAATPESGARPVPLPVRPRPVAAWSGWLAAAAALVLAVAGWLQFDRAVEERGALAARQAALEAALAALEEPAPAELRAALEGRPDTLVLPWSATDDPAARGAHGQVLWSPEQQAGVMHFRGLAPNDPAVAQYQLWIFDAGRDDRFPVDGGVFDIPGGVDEALVPIRARLPVGEAVLFAITVEAPGGVVVSARERIALVAQPGA
jgi:hypothetical protein